MMSKRSFSKKKVRRRKDLPREESSVAKVVSVLSAPRKFREAFSRRNAYKRQEASEKVIYDGTSKVPVKLTKSGKGDF